MRSGGLNSTCDSRRPTLDPCLSQREPNSVLELDHVTNVTIFLKETATSGWGSRCHNTRTTHEIIQPPVIIKIKLYSSKIQSLSYTIPRFQDQNHSSAAKQLVNTIIGSHRPNGAQVHPNQSRWVHHETNPNHATHSPRAMCPPCSTPIRLVLVTACSNPEHTYHT